MQLRYNYSASNFIEMHAELDRAALKLGFHACTQRMYHHPEDAT